MGWRVFPTIRAVREGNTQLVPVERRHRRRAVVSTDKLPTVSSIPSPMLFPSHDDDGERLLVRCSRLPMKTARVQIAWIDDGASSRQQHVARRGDFGAARRRPLHLPG